MSQHHHERVSADAGHDSASHVDDQHRPTTAATAATAAGVSTPRPSAAPCTASPCRHPVDTLSTLPLLEAGRALGTTLSVVLAADTLSIGAMEVTDDVVMTLMPGATNAGLVNVIWVGMMISLTVAFFAAWPVNRYLLQRGTGHALTHGFHGAATAEGARGLIPSFSTDALVATILALLVGGSVVSIADELATDSGSGPDAGQVVQERPAPDGVSVLEDPGLD